MIEYSPVAADLFVIKKIVTDQEIPTNNKCHT